MVEAAGIIIGVIGLFAAFGALLQAHRYNKQTAVLYKKLQNTTGDIHKSTTELKETTGDVHETAKHLVDLTQKIDEKLNIVKSALQKRETDLSTAAVDWGLSPEQKNKFDSTVAASSTALIDAIDDALNLPMDLEFISQFFEGKSVAQNPASGGFEAED